MARMPGAQFRPTPTGALMARYDVVCIHTIVGFAPAPAAHFSTSGNGTITQSRDTRFQSAANFQGNHRVLAIENEDHGPAFGGWSGSNVPPLTDEQIEACARICAWAHETHGIPLVACPSSRPGARGIGYHRQGIDGNFGSFRYGGRVSGGEQWSTSFGKVCPGDRRISQIPAIIRRAKEIAGGDDDMPLSKDDLDKIKNIVDRKVRMGVRYTDNGNPSRAYQGHTLRRVRAEIGQLRDLVATQGGLTVEQVTAAVQAAMPDTNELALAVADAVDHELDTEAVERALRDVLGGLNEEEV